MTLTSKQRDTDWIFGVPPSPTPTLLCVYKTVGRIVYLSTFDRYQSVRTCTHTRTHAHTAYLAVFLLLDLVVLQTKYEMLKALSNVSYLRLRGMYTTYYPARSFLFPIKQETFVIKKKKKTTIKIFEKKSQIDMWDFFSVWNFSPDCSVMDELLCTYTISPDLRWLVRLTTPLPSSAPVYPAGAGLNMARYLAEWAIPLQ